MKKKGADGPNKIYFDSCILIAFFSTNKEEKTKKEVIKSSLQVLAQIEGVQFFTSHWALAEMTNILICRHRMTNAKVAQIEQELLNTERLGILKVKIIEALPRFDYSVKEYLYNVRKAILQFHSGVGDCMHWVAINNNHIDTILTFDGKSDFKKIPNLTVVNPKDLLTAGKALTD